MTRTGAAPEPPERPTAIGERVVTVDLDDADKLDLLRAWHTLDDAGAYDIEARTSSSGEGFHVRGWIDDDDADELDIETIRLAAGDHPRRTFMDRDHTHKPSQVVFTRKGDAEAGPWHSDPWDAADELVLRSDRGPW